jgi:hypothetical protein
LDFGEELGCVVQPDQGYTSRAAAPQQCDRAADQGELVVEPVVRVCVCERAAH